jgi:arylsulfatase A
LRPMGVMANKNQLLRNLRFLLLAVVIGTVAAAADRPPNFIVIYADDLGYGDLGVYGHPSIRTPNIDRMAAEGVRMTEFYSAAPTCSPARAALLTGRYPLRSGLVRVLVPKEKWGIPASEVTLAEALKERGYSTAIVGKWHLGGRRPFRPLRHGFDYFYGVLHSNDMSLLPVVQWPRVALFQDDTSIESPANVRTLTRRYTEQSVEFIREHKDQPFFLYLAHTMPHIPLRPSKDFKGQSEYGVYGDVVEELDWSTGEVLKALKENGIDENTFVVFTSDNGPYVGGVREDAEVDRSHRRRARGSSGPLRGAKGTTWEGGMRVPLVARWPAQLPAGLVRRGVATQMDLFTTLIEAAGGELPGDRVIDGKNILGMLRGAETSPHEDFYYFFRSRIFAVRSATWKLHLYARHLGPKGQALDAVKLSTPQLYDLAADSGEQHDLASRHPEIVQRLTGMAASFGGSIEPVMKLPPATKSFLSGITTHAPKSPDKVPK